MRRGTPKAVSDLVDLLALIGERANVLADAPGLVRDLVRRNIGTIVADEARFLSTVRAARELLPGLAPATVTDALRRAVQPDIEG